MGELINFNDILFHLLNLIILVVAARFLLYKPVSKFMEERSGRFALEREAIKTAKIENENFKKNMDTLMLDAQKKAAEYLQAQKVHAEKQAEIIIDQARASAGAESRQIVENTRAELMSELEKHKVEIVNASVEIARNILDREIVPQDEEKLLADFIRPVH